MLVWLVVGVALAAALTLARGPVAATWTDGARRVGALGLAGAVLGLAVGLGASVLASGAVLSLWVCGTLTTWAAAWATLALERLVGLLGIGVAVTLLLGLATPLVTAADPRNLVAPWSDGRHLHTPPCRPGLGPASRVRRHRAEPGPTWRCSARGA